MARICTICTHVERLRIDQALVEGRSFRDVAEQFAVSTSSLHRHRENHLPASLAKAQEAQEIRHGDTLLEQLQVLRDKALAVLARAEEADDWRGALGAIKEARGCLELMGKVTGELKTSQELNVSFSFISVLEQVDARRRALEGATLKVIEHDDASSEDGN